MKRNSAKQIKSLFLTMAIVAILCFVSTADAQRQGGQRGGPGGGPPPPRDMNQGNANNHQAQQQGNQGGRNQNGNQDMPTVEQLAQMMITNFDADGNGELSQTELQSALMALREKMQSQGNSQNDGGDEIQGAGQNQAGQQRNQGGNQQARQGGRQQGGQGNVRRGR